jgi:hypothetical protein
MFRNREQFHVCKTHLLYITHETGGRLPVTKEAIPLLWNTLPGTQMYFIDGHRSIKCINRMTFSHPFPVAPIVV